MASQANEQSRRRARILERVLADGRAPLRRQAARHAGAPADADDALQEACLQFLRYYDGDPGEPALRWLMLCVKHRAWELGARRRDREALAEVAVTDACDPEAKLLQVLAAAPGPAERAERDEDATAFFAALARLKPDERTALLLLGLGCSYREIGQLRGWTHTKINRCLAEGRAALRALEKAES
jgi:RNA polymerase sigma factor (sigma-70 family)